MIRKSLKKWLVAANGWQRIWLVCSVICSLYFIIIFPLAETSKGSSFRYEMRWATEREIKNPICAPYMNNQFSNLFEPQYSTDGSTCYHIYSHRKYSENNNPITETMYQEYFDSKEREMWLKYIGMGALISTLLSMFVYSAGVVVSWIIKGFKKGEEQ